MRVLIAYPVPCENSEVIETFAPFVERFARSFHDNPPGVKCTVVALGCEKEVPSEFRYIFEEWGVPVHCETYSGRGMDLGAQQFCAAINPGAFQLNLTTRCYFHRPGWLARMVKARLEFGPALYGCSASYEGGTFHLCTRGHAYDTDDFNLYPTEIKSRDQGVFFELGDGNVLRWFESIGREAYVVHWSGEMEIGRGRTGFRQRGFRSEDQSEMLIWDKHTDAYRNADPEEQDRLQKIHHGIALT